MTFIPPKTAALLTEHIPQGERHKAALDIAMSLIGNGITPSAVLTQLRDKFPAVSSDKELQDVVAYCVRANPSPSGFGERKTFTPRQFTPAPSPTPKQKTPEEHAAWWLSNATMTQDDFCTLTQLPIPVERGEALSAFLEMLYQGAENLNVVCKFVEKDGKARPDGPGRILSRDKWCEYLLSSGVPDGKAGAWFRPNPVAASGSGSSGAVTDSDVTAFRFLLLESDKLKIETQFALFAKLRLPIAAAYLSGGISVHALARIDAANSEDFDRKARRITSMLAPFGIDQANKNPSRLSRLPGARRKIGASGDGIQQLLWLNPNRVAITEDGIAELEESLLCPAIEERPFRRVVLDSINRYEELHRNRGQLGVPTGFPTFDSVSGGLKPGGYTLIAAETGVGKSTIALNIINAALQAGVGVVLFTLEMSRDDIADMMFSLNCRVNRNVFNTGEFSEQDFKAMIAGAGQMKNLPFWLDDDPDADMPTVRRRVLALKADNRIGLAVLDYAQLLKPETKSFKREEEVASIALALRLLSRQADIPIIVLSQLNDDGKVRESRRLSHEAANVFRLKRKDLSDPAVTLLIDKGRKIPGKPIDLWMESEFCRITEKAKIQPQDYNDR